MKTNKLFPVLVCLSVCAAEAASLPDNRVLAPTAVARITGGDYCFARVRRLEPERQPPSYLVLRLKIQVAYLNSGRRPLIIPLDHERVIYTALKPGMMNIFHELPIVELLSPSLKPMKDLPPRVSPDNPVDPRNDYFSIIPAGGDLVSSIIENITFPVNHKNLLRHDPDLRGHRLYIRLQLNQQELTPALLTDLSDRWTKFGTPWTGSVTTNVMTIDVPQQIAQAGASVDGPFETPGNHQENLGAK
jgi:hypothetical protein